MNLTQLQIGQSGILEPPRSLTPAILRLMEMGMTAGAEVTLTRRAPLGDPLELSVRGTRLCLRASEASQFGILRAERSAP